MALTSVIAHILTPHDLGIFAIATTIFTIVTAIGEFGVVSCLIRADLDIEALAPTLSTISWASSVIMAVCIYVFAKPIAVLLGSGEATGPVRVMAYVVIIWGVAAVPTAQCIRDFKQSKLFLADVLAFIPSTALLLLLGLHGNGAMSFAWSRVVGQLTSCTVVTLAAPKFYAPGMTRGALRVLFRFGLPTAAANFINNFLSNIDYAFIGHLVQNTALLGTYMIAFNVSTWATSLLGGMLTSVSTSAFSRVKDDPDRLISAMADSVRAVTLIAAPTCLLVMTLSRPIILTLYGKPYASAIPVLEILSVYGFISIIGKLYTSLLVALGRPRAVLIIQLIWLGGIFPAMAIGVHKDGIVGAAIAHIAIITPVVLPSYLIVVRRATGIRLSLLIKAALGPLTAAAIAATLAWYAAGRFDRPFLQVMAGMAAGGLCYAILTLPQLVMVVGRGRLSHPVLRRVLRAYTRAGRLLGIPMGPPPRHARRVQQGYVRRQRQYVRHTVWT